MNRSITWLRGKVARVIAAAVLVAAGVLALLQFVALGAIHAQPQTHASSQASVTTFATGLNNPRGLTFGPDDNLYVAEGGTTTNTLSTAGPPPLCEQVPSPVGPYTGGFTGMGPESPRLQSGLHGPPA
jgi:hypothetical protein